MQSHYYLRRKSPCRQGTIMQFVITIAILLSSVVEARWNATGVVRNLWATPIMEYKGLFSDEQLAAFANDVKTSWATFLKHRSENKGKVVTKAQAYGTSTANDKDKINEEFFNYQSRNPINAATLETVWQGFVFACNKFVEETGMPPIEYQRETLTGGSIEWTKDKFPKRGNQYCWGSVQFGGTHHDVHTHPGSSLAGTLYLEVPADGGALSLSDPRGPMPPFNYAYRLLPEAGKYVIFPGTLPHAVHATPGELPRVSISCNHPGDWKKFTTSKVVWGESTWSHEMMSREDHEAAAKAKR